MNLAEIFFGSNKASDFRDSIPIISLRGLVFLLIKIILFVILLPVLLGGLILLIGKDSYAKNELTQAMVFMFLIYTSMIVFSYRYFYSSFAKLKAHLFSLKSTDVLKQAILLIITATILSYVLNVIGFILNPSGIHETLVIFNNSTTQDINYLEIVFLPLLWILVGLGEELLFRAGIYRSLRNNYSMIISLISTSLLFTLLHPMSIINSMVIFAISMLYGFYFEYKNNLLTIAIAHTFQDLMIAGISAYSSAYTANLILKIF